MTVTATPSSNPWPLTFEAMVETFALPVSRFVDKLTGPAASAIAFQTFIPGGSPGDGSLTRILHGSVADHATTLFALNEKGAAVTMVVNETDRQGRKIENIIAIRAAFIDCDGDLRVEPAVPPSIVVLGRDDRPHLYFKLRSGEDKGRFTALQTLLSCYYGSDPTVKDLSRCMRLPGFMHWADGSRVVPRAIYAPTWTVAEGGIVHFHEPEPEMMLVPSEDGGEEVFEDDPEIPEYTISQLLSAHGFGESEFAQIAVAETPVYDADSFPVEERIRRAEIYAENTPGAIEREGGDEHTYKLACKLVRGFDLEEDDALPVMEKWNETCAPPWTSEDLLRKVRLAETHGTDQRGYLLDQTAAASIPPAPVSLGVESTQPKYVVSLGDFLDEPDEANPSYWDDGLLDKANVLLISGPMQVRKSWFVIQLGLMLALGRDFLGHAVKQSVRVLLIECESSRTRYRQRIRKIAAGLGIDLPRDTVFVKQRHSPIPQIGPELEIAIRESRAEVIILDTLNNFFDGDENSNTEVQAKVYKHLRAISDKLEWQPSFVLVHHFSKTSRSGDTLPSRGAALLEQGAGSVFHLELDGDLTKVIFKKVRDGERLEPTRLAFQNFVLREVEDNDIGKPKLTESQVLRFAFCRDFALNQNREVKTEEFTKALIERFGTAKEIARKTAPDAAKHGYLRKADRKGLYLPAEDFSDGNGNGTGSDGRTDGVDIAPQMGGMGLSPLGETHPHP